MYTALEVAKYIINKCIELNRPISNLQLQKILYYVQGEYMKKNNGQALFNDDIEAWQYGPVVPNVYYKFNIFSSGKIDTQQTMNEPIRKDDYKDIDSIIECKSKLSPWELVKSTHSELPWKKNYELGKNCLISKEDLKTFFMN